MSLRTRLAFWFMKLAAKLDLVVVIVVSESIVLSLVEGAIKDGLVLINEEQSQWPPTRLN